MSVNGRRQTAAPAIGRRAARQAAKNYIDLQIRTMKKHGALKKNLSQRKYLQLVAEAERLVVTANHS
ncbi:MAG: hypothetical protein WA175_03175 [Candidatus Acidiferrales bacterium]